MSYHGNQVGRRKLACQLMMLSEFEGRPIADFGQALLAINADFEYLHEADEERLWERWASTNDALLIETDTRERMRLQFMLAKVGTALKEIREA